MKNVFSKTFYVISSWQTCESLETEFWIVLNVALPHRIKTKADGVKDINYYSDKLHDNVLEAILQRTYDMFKIFTGNFTNFLKIFLLFFFINLVL